MRTLLTSVILGVFFLSASSYGQDDHLVETNFKKKVFKNPLREISVIVTDDGFYPNKIMAFKGDKVRFYITSTSKKNHLCFVLHKHEVFVSAEKGKVNEVEVLIENPGRYKFYCPSTKYVGYLTVFEKFSEEEDQKRSIASEVGSGKPNYWIPRDYD